MELTEILEEAIRENASDVILKDGAAPMFRLRGDLAPMPGAEPLTEQDIQRAANRFLQDDTHRMRFATERHADLAFDEPEIGRFRINVYRQRGKIGIVLRIIPSRIYDFRELNLPPVLEQIAEERRGLILVTGPTGSGKTTTLAAMVDYINKNHPKHIITIEDPIEYIHDDRLSVVSQREIGMDTDDFPSALRVALRQNPDVIMVGEMRDQETMETAITAAETGHLVLSTLHTVDAPETVTRIIASFPEHRRDQARVILASILRGVISQRLLPTSNGKGLVPAVEIMRGTARVREHIDKNRIRELHEVIAQGQSAYGMQTFDQSLLHLFRDGLIMYEDAISHCTSPSDFELQAKGIDSANLGSFQAQSSLEED